MKVQTILTTLSLLIAPFGALSFAALPAKAESSVDPVNQAYFVSETDMIAGVSMERRYSSRSVHRGYFGAGWCSELDARILIFDGGETRYRGCDLRNATMIDERIRDSRQVRLSVGGFQRTREDGAIQIFDRAGWLVKIERKKIAIEIHRDALGTPTELIVKTAVALRAAQLKVEAGLLREVTMQGGRLKFEYEDGLLVKAPGSRYAYDRMLNMILRMSARAKAPSVNEAIVYDDQEDRVVQIARSDAFGQERRLLTLARKGTSVEMKIEEERGAETHPVFVSYDRTSGRLSLQGNRELAKILLSWIRV